MKPKTEKLYIEMVAAFGAGKSVEQVGSEYGKTRKSVENAFARLRRKYKAVHTCHLLMILTENKVIEVETAKSIRRLIQRTDRVLANVASLFPINNIHKH
jgi:hypothetical protein